MHTCMHIIRANFFNPKKAGTPETATMTSEEDAACTCAWWLLDSTPECAYVCLWTRASLYVCVRAYVCAWGKS